MINNYTRHNNLIHSSINAVTAQKSAGLEV